MEPFAALEDEHGKGFWRRKRPDQMLALLVCEVGDLAQDLADGYSSGQRKSLARIGALAAMMNERMPPVENGGPEKP